MPSNKNNKRKKNSKNRQTDFKRELVYRDEYQRYARVTKLLGNRRLTCECFDGKDRLALIRGSMRKRVWINAGDLILIALRGFQDGKCDVIHKYSSDEERYLKKQVPLKIMLKKMKIQKKKMKLFHLKIYKNLKNYF